ncbi:MAG: peptidoglycan bridge formation glycyltransferase FemA/FemB family protein [Merdibacter sp.]
MYTFNENVAPERHDAFVRQSPLCNLLQSSDWAKVKENWDHAIVGVEDEEGLKASAMVLIGGFRSIYDDVHPAGADHGSYG